MLRFVWPLLLCLSISASAWMGPVLVGGTVPAGTPPSGVAITGSIVKINDSGASGSQAVSVPADATAALVFYGGYTNACGIAVSSMTLGGDGFTSELARTETTWNETGLFWLVNPSTGSQTFAWTFTCAWNSEGPQILIVFVTGSNTTTPIRDSNYGEASDSATTGTFNSGTSDLVIVFGTGAATIDAGVSGQSEVYDTGVFNSAYAAIGTKAGASPTTTGSATGTGNMTALACSITPP